MTEAEWLVCESVDALLDQVVPWATERHIRLFAGACCRRVSHLYPGPRFLPYLDLAERLADDPSCAAEALRAEHEIEAVIDWDTHGIVASVAVQAVGRALQTDRALYGPKHAWEEAAIALDGEQLFPASAAETPVADWPEPDRRLLNFWLDSWVGSNRLRWDTSVYAVFADILREVFGNPFRPIRFDPAWLAPTVTSLAATIYDQHAFDRLPSLADALVDAGCPDRDVLEHLRGPGEHVRGCWVVDACLGRT